MFAHIEGNVSEKLPDALVVDVHGIGFLLSVSKATLAAAPAAGERMKLYTILNMREDAMDLVGFYSKEEKQMYERLRGVTGIGRKTALDILSAISLRDLSVALVTGDAKALERVPGVGKKTAQRLVLELKDKVDNSMLTGSGISAAVVSAPAASAESEAIDALIALGYSAAEAAKAVSQVASGTDKVDEMIFLALKKGGR